MALSVSPYSPKPPINAYYIKSTIAVLDNNGKWRVQLKNIKEIVNPIIDLHRGRRSAPRDSAAERFQSPTRGVYRK